MQRKKTCFIKNNKEIISRIHQCPHFVEVQLDMKLRMLKNIKTKQLMRCIYHYTVKKRLNETMGIHVNFT